MSEINIEEAALKYWNLSLRLEGKHPDLKKMPKLTNTAAFDEVERIIEVGYPSNAIQLAVAKLEHYVIHREVVKPKTPATVTQISTYRNQKEAANVKTS